MKPTCRMCGCRIEGEKVPHGKGWRHPECEKPARGYLPARPLSPGQQVERAGDKREEKRQSSNVH